MSLFRCNNQLCRLIWSEWQQQQYQTIKVIISAGLNMETQEWVKHLDMLCIFHVGIKHITVQEVYREKMS